MKENTKEIQNVKKPTVNINAQNILNTSIKVGFDSAAFHLFSNLKVSCSPPTHSLSRTTSPIFLISQSVQS